MTHRFTGSLADVSHWVSCSHVFRIGSWYSPFLPLMAILKLPLVFYAKKVRIETSVFYEECAYWIAGEFLHPHVPALLEKSCFLGVLGAISRAKRALPYPARMLFLLIIAWIGNKVITYYLKIPFFPISANLTVRFSDNILGQLSVHISSPKVVDWFFF